MTSRATASTLQVETFGSWLTSGFGGSVSGAATYGSIETGIGVSVGVVANFVAVSLAYEGGVGIGAAVNATLGYHDDCTCDG